MKDEQIAREFLSLSCGDDICGVMDRKSCKCFREIVDALATARRAGFDAAKEQAAEVCETHTWERDIDWWLTERNAET